MREPIPARTRFEVFKRDKFRCGYCGRSAPHVVLHVDHIVPVSKGGANSMQNYVTACSDCNLGKSNIPLRDEVLWRLCPDRLRVTACPGGWLPFLAALPVKQALEINDHFEWLEWRDRQDALEYHGNLDAEVDAWEAELRDMAAYYSDNEDYSQWEECA